MRKALFVTSVLLILVSSSYSKDENKSFSSLKYNYVIESDLSLTDFSDAFFERLKTKHNWNEIYRNDCQDEVCQSEWSFTDEEANEWKCEVVIKKANEGSNRMLVSMEMNPVMGS
ncbi:MAG TPA: hypothetical protein VGK25_05975 [Ignavibacteria bacterium]|jgi:hypothetical protein